jgi:hypothetical protein
MIVPLVSGPVFDLVGELVVGGEESFEDLVIGEVVGQP